MKIRKLLAASFGATCMAIAGQAAAVPVALELALLVDVSGSVDNTEYNLQRQGYVDAFNDPGIQAQIAARPGGIAVTYIVWSGANEQSVEVGWTHITDATSAGNFATAVSNVTLDFGGLTAPGSAINFTVPLFSGNGFEGTRLVIDVSGDGTENDGDDTSDARDAALLAGINAINGLAIGGATIETFYQNNIQGGAGSFTIGVSDFDDFPPAVRSKIGREITGVPEPGSLALIGLAFAGLAFFRRRRA